MSISEAMTRRRRRSFSPEFKAEVVELCRQPGRNPSSVAAELGLTETAVAALGIGVRHLMWVIWPRYNVCEPWSGAPKGSAWPGHGRGGRQRRRVRSGGRKGPSPPPESVCQPELGHAVVPANHPT